MIDKIKDVTDTLWSHFRRPELDHNTTISVCMLEDAIHCIALQNAYPDFNLNPHELDLVLDIYDNHSKYTELLTNYIPLFNDAWELVLELSKDPNYNETLYSHIKKLCDGIIEEEV